MMDKAATQKLENLGIRKLCSAILIECGIEIEWASAIVLDDGAIVLEARYSGDVTFEALEKVSIAFGTKKIDLSYETGCESNPCHDHDIRIEVKEDVDDFIRRVVLSRIVCGSPTLTTGPKEDE